MYTNVDEQRVKAVEQQRNDRFTTSDREIEVQEMEYKVRRFIGDYVISPKNEYKLNRWLEWAQRFQSEIERNVIVRNGHELSRLYEIEHIVSCATYSAIASLERKESRWGDKHHRTDYPERDDQNWLKHIILSKGDKAGDIRVEARPVVGLNGKEVLL